MSSDALSPSFSRLSVVGSISRRPLGSFSVSPDAFSARCELIVSFHDRRREFVSQAVIECQLGRDLKIVLGVEEQQTLSVIQDRVAREDQPLRQPEQEVANGAAGEDPVAEGHTPDQRVDVTNPRLY